MRSLSFFNFLFLSSVALNCTLYAAGSGDEFDLDRQGNANVSIKPVQTPESPQEQAAQRGWGLWFKETAVGAVSIISTAAQKAKKGWDDAIEAEKIVRDGIDLYSPLKTAAGATIESSQEVSKHIHPVAANFITGFYNQINSVFGNLLVNTSRLGGAPLAGKLAKELNLSQQALNMGLDCTVSGIVPLNPFSNPYVKGLSYFVQGIDKAALVGKATKGVAAIVSEQANKVIDSAVSKSLEGRLLNISNSDTPGISQSALNGVAARAKKSKDLFVTNTIKKTLASLSDNLGSQYLPENLTPIIKILLVGAEKETQEKAQDLSTASHVLSTVNKVKSYFQPSTIVSLLVPSSLRAAYNGALSQVNQAAGATLGEVTVDFVGELVKQNVSSAQVKLFDEEQLRISLPSVSGAEAIKPYLEPMLSEIFQSAGEQVAKRLLGTLEESISKKASALGLPYDVKDLMYSRIQPSFAARMAMPLARAIAWGGYYGYQELRTILTTNPMEAIYPQLREGN